MFNILSLSNYRTHAFRCELVAFMPLINSQWHIWSWMLSGTLTQQVEYVFSEPCTELAPPCGHLQTPAVGRPHNICSAFVYLYMHDIDYILLHVCLVSIWREYNGPNIICWSRFFRWKFRISLDTINAQISTLWAQMRLNQPWFSKWVWIWACCLTKSSFEPTLGY